MTSSIADVDGPWDTIRETPNSWPTTGELRDSLEAAVMDAMAEGRLQVIRSETASGKTHTGATTPWSERAVTDGEPVIHLHGTKAARDEAANKSEEAGVEYHVLLSREEACETAAGKHDETVETPNGQDASEWIADQCGSGAGTTFSNAHSTLKDYNDGELPCCPCEAITQWDGIPRDEDGESAVDVIHATHQFAFVPTLTNQTNLLVDEQPDFEKSLGPGEELTQQRIQRMVSCWLKKIGAMPTTWESFVTLARDGFESLAETVGEDYAVEPEWFITEPDAHTLAPAVTEALFDALSHPSDDNGLQTGFARNDITRFEAKEQDDKRLSRTRVQVMIDENNQIQALWNAPEFGSARSAICLDAWPAKPQFRQNIGESLDFIELMTIEERRKWRIFERGLEVVQIGDAARPAGSDYAAENYTNFEELLVVIDWLRTMFGEEFRSVIAPSKIEDDVQDMMRDVGIDSPESWTMHQGEEKSRGDFSDESVGLVTNCLDPGDDPVLNLVAARELDATPAMKECGVCAGEGCLNCDQTGDRRLPGRGYDGPDAETAEEILDGVRANHTNQCVGRYARKPDDPENGALVFVRTDTVDDSLVDKKIPDPWVFGDKQRAAVDHLRDHQDTTLKQTVEAIESDFENGVTKQSVKDTYSKLIEYSVAERSESTGAYGADEYWLTAPVPDRGLLKMPEIHERKPPNDP
jgi:hypothetical protein